MIRKNILAGVLVGAFAMSIGTATAGNEDRAGSAGAMELLINPWARSSGWAGAGAASVNGIEATYMNVAGLSFTEKTEVVFARTMWMVGSDVNINAVGLAQRVGGSSVLGLHITSMDFGDIPITTVALPEGGIGTFSPQYTNIAMSYSREFSNSIYGGAQIKIINQTITDLRATGVAIDAGIRYVTGERDHVKFGISLKNVGPPMAFSGDGLSFTVDNPVTGDAYTTEQRSADFELPSLVNIGLSYEFDMGEQHNLIAAGTFTSNSFTRDQFRLGLLYKFNTEKATFMARGGYMYEKGVLDDTRATAYVGPTGGFSVDFGFGENNTRIGIDYSYRVTQMFGGTHTIGARINVN